jgi:hypothetical protein
MTMAERDDLLDSICTTTADYRAGEIPAPTPSHVNTWANQFDGAVQLPLLREMAAVLKKTYFTRANVVEFIEGLITNPALAGANPASFWKTICFLDIQGGGGSQKAMLALFDHALKQKMGFGIQECGKGSTVFLYLDDAIFSGGRVRHDLQSWLSDQAPKSATVHVVSIAFHRGGQWYASQQLPTLAANQGKQLTLTWWRVIEFEDRRAHTSSSDVLRPVEIPNDGAVQQYVAAMQYQPVLRAAGNVGPLGVFSSDEARQLLEREFLKAGVRIRQIAPNLSARQRPLGHSTLETLGFGSMLVTFRNCPNNAPLALWAGDPWYPLFPRVTNTDTAMKALLAGF